MWTRENRIEVYYYDNTIILILLIATWWSLVLIKRTFWTKVLHQLHACNDTMNMYIYTGVYNNMWPPALHSLHSVATVHNIITAHYLYSGTPLSLFYTPLGQLKMSQLKELSSFQGYPCRGVQFHCTGDHVYTPHTIVPQGLISLNPVRSLWE